MKGKIYKRVTLTVTALVLAFILLPSVLFAAGSYSASLGASTINVGKSTNVNITTTNAAGKFTVTSSNPAVAAVSLSTTWVDGRMDNAITVKGVKAGTATITVTPTNVSDNEYNLLTNSKSFTITVKETQTNTNNNTNTGTSTPTKKPTTTTTTTKTEQPKSSDATLKSLTIKNNDIKFASNITKYTVDVDKTVTSLDLSAIPNSEKANVKVEGNGNFKVGTNVVKITVTAEDGTSKVYEITVVKSKYGTGPLIDLEVVGYEFEEEFDPSVLKYSVQVVGLDSVEIEYVLADKDSTVEIEGNENLKIGKNIIKVIVTEKDGTKTTYEIEVTVLEDTVEKSNTIWIIIIIILSILVIVEAVYIVLKNKKENK